MCSEVRERDPKKVPVETKSNQPAFTPPPKHFPHGLGGPLAQCPPSVPGEASALLPAVMCEHGFVAVRALIKVICGSGPTEQRPPRWPGPHHRSKPKSGALRGDAFLPRKRSITNHSPSTQLGLTYLPMGKWITLGKVGPPCPASALSPRPLHKAPIVPKPPGRGLYCTWDTVHRPPWMDCRLLDKGHLSHC